MKVGIKWKKKKKTKPTEWVIYDKTDMCLYFYKDWESEEEAQEELADLLKCYPMDNPWHKRLVVHHMEHLNTNNLIRKAVSYG